MNMMPPSAAPRRRRQRHGRHAHGRGAAEARARPLRHHRVRRRAARQLQPHPAVAGAGGREDARRDRHQQPRAGTRENGITLHAGDPVGRHRPPRADGDARPRGIDVRLRPAAAGHRLEAARAAVPGADLPGVLRLPRSRRRRRDAERARRDAQARRGHRRRPAGPRSGLRPAAARHGGHRRPPDADT